MTIVQTNDINRDNSEIGIENLFMIEIIRMSHMFKPFRLLKLVIPWIYDMPAMRNASCEDALLVIWLRMYNTDTTSSG